MSGKKNKTSILAEALGLSGEQAKAFGDEVNRILSAQGRNAASFEDIAAAASTLPRTNRTARSIAARILQGPEANAGSVTKQDGQPPGPLRPGTKPSTSNADLSARRPNRPGFPYDARASANGRPDDLLV